MAVVPVEELRVPVQQNMMIGGKKIQVPDSSHGNTG